MSNYPPQSFQPSKPMGPISLNYGEAFNYIFRNPDWTTAILLGAVTFLIPLVGPFVYIGYCFDVVESLYLSGGARYPSYNFERFGEQLMRGLWVFLVQLVAGLVFILVIAVVIGVPYLLAHFIGQAAGKDVGGILMMLAAIWHLVAELALIVGANIVLIPLILRAGLSQDFSSAFQFDWIKDFARKMWLEMVLSVLVMMVAGMLLVPLGLLACCIGVYAVIPFMQLVQAHFNFQLYSIYLARGGQPIPLKPGPHTPQMFAPPM